MYIYLISVFLPCLQLYGHDLESQFSHFQDWLKVFNLHKGKANVEDYEEDEEERLMGRYKVTLTEIFQLTALLSFLKRK